MPAQAAPKKNRSAMKRARQTETRSLKNKSTKNMLKTLCKKVDTAVADKKADRALPAFKEAVSAIDKAARKGIIHKNTASRRISRLARLVNSTHPSGAA